MIGLYVGVIPVALGLLWLPLASRLGKTGIDVLLALTVGLLVFLFIDAAHEALEAAAAMPSSYQGVALFVSSAFARLPRARVVWRVAAGKARTSAQCTARPGRCWHF